MLSPLSLLDSLKGGQQKMVILWTQSLKNQVWFLWKDGDGDTLNWYKEKKKADSQHLLALTGCFHLVNF